MKQFFIRHKPSGLFIPNSNLSHGKRQTGGSKVEPGPQENARVFPTRQSARCFLNQWLRGVHSYKEDYFGDIDFKIVPVASREAEDMEILEYDIDLNRATIRRV